MFKPKKKSRSGRTREQLLHHYEVERQIANRLRHSTREQRIEATKNMYDKLFAQLPYHPLLTERYDPKRVETVVDRNLRLLKPYLLTGQSFLEFGPGNCSLAFRLCSEVGRVYAVDISEQIDPSKPRPENFRFIIYDGYSIDLPDNCIDVVFSNQVIEHMHPDDTPDHFRLVHRLLKPKGVYVFTTPQKLCGPADISRYFSDVAEGFHLREWTFRELANLAKNASFSNWQGRWFAKGICMPLPKWLILALEELIGSWPVKIRQRVGPYLLPGVVMIVQK
jgi:SAM-dependent methyltransferase